MQLLTVDTFKGSCGDMQTMFYAEVTDNQKVKKNFKPLFDFYRCELMIWIFTILILLK